MSIRSQILLPIIGSLILGVVFGVFVAWHGLRDHARVEAVVLKALQAKDLSREILENFLAAQDVMDRVRSSTLSAPKEIQNAFNDTAGPLGQHIDELKAASLSNEMEAVTSSLANDYADWLLDTFVVLKMREADQVPSSAKMKEHLKKLTASIDTLTGLASSDAQAIIKRTGQEKNTALVYQLILALMIIIAGGGLAFFIARGLSRPMLELVGSAEKLAGGDISVRFDQQNRSDEIGAVAKAIAGFRDGVMQRVALEEKAKTEQARKEERQRQTRSAIDAFNSQAEQVLQSMNAKLADMEQTAETLSNMSSDSSGKAEDASSASVSADKNVQAVSAAAEELSASISEISSQITSTSVTVANATENARATNGMVAGLSQAAGRIGDVVLLIQGIAEQTNLLALNATIEAARAGDAGKGFSVVAAEVKGLADQTAKATDDIAQLIREIQNSTEGAVVAIKDIADTVEEVNSFTSAIAAAMKEQGASTAEISRNVAAASDETSVAKASAQSVGQSITQTSQGVADMKAVAREASVEMQQFNKTVQQFLSQVRAA